MEIIMTVPVINEDRKTKMLHHKDMIDRGHALDDWMNNIAADLLRVISLLEQDRETYGNNIPRNLTLSEILENAAMEISVYYTIDKKDGRLIPHCLGPI
jgi:hypothetical protein